MSKKKKTGILPEHCVLVVKGVGKQGDLVAEPRDKELAGRYSKIFVIENRRIKPVLQEGDEFIGRLILRKGAYFVKPVARTSMSDVPTEKIYGIIEKKGGKYYLKASEKNIRRDYLLDAVGNGKEGDFVSIALGGDKRFKQAHIVKNFGKFDLNKATASLVLDKYDIPYVFNEKIAKELACCPHFHRQGRLDMTNVPLVTIDGEDAKDFDDAVWAEKTDIGFNLIVAIADVSFYVRPGSELDREVYRRGNSVYLPNMFIPMLPEQLCNGLCSLMPLQPRASIVCLMQIDREGQLKGYEFKRAVIRSAARLTYREVQEALDGEKSENIAPVFNGVVLPLFEAYQALDKARRKRGALDLESSEIKIKVDKKGVIQSIAREETYTSNKIVEEFMIAANVAAALALKKSRLPVMYRVHDLPPEEKLEDIKPLLHNLKLKLPDAGNLKPRHLNKVIELCSKNGYAQGISDMILRLQAQAQYSPHNIGHFGLALKDYVHFTSPIRRYADLLIHRALVRAFEMPDGGALEEGATVSAFEDIGRHLCETERKAVNAERDLTARFVSAYLEPAVGQDFEVKITGMTNAGMFVRIESLGAEGLIPLSSLPDDYYSLVPGNIELAAENSGLVFKLGQKITARLVEASPITGGLIFKYLDPEDGDQYYEKGGRRSFNFAAKRQSAPTLGSKAKKKKGAKAKKGKTNAKN